MANRQTIYLNGVEAGPGLCSYPHLDQPRQFKGKGDFRYDITVIVTPEVAGRLNTQALELAQQFFTEDELRSQFFRWPAKEINKASWTDCPEHYLKLFSGMFAVKCGRKADKGQPGRKDGINLDPKGDPTPINMPGQFKPGNIVIAAVDFATYAESGTNLGIATYLGEVVKFGEGNPFAEGGASASISQESLAAARAVAVPTVPEGAAPPSQGSDVPTPSQAQVAPPGTTAQHEAATASGGTHPTTGVAVPGVSQGNQTRF